MGKERQIEKTITTGPIDAIVWKEETGAEPLFYGVTIIRAYRDELGCIREVPSFEEDYLEEALYCLSRAQRYIMSLK